MLLKMTLDTVYCENDFTVGQSKNSGSIIFIVLKLMGKLNFIRDKILPGQLPEKQLRN